MELWQMKRISYTFWHHSDSLEWFSTVFQITKTAGQMNNKRKEILLVSTVCHCLQYILCHLVFVVTPYGWFYHPFFFSR